MEINAKNARISPNPKPQLHSINTFSVIPGTETDNSPDPEKLPTPTFVTSDIAT